MSGTRYGDDVDALDAWTRLADEYVDEVQDPENRYYVYHVNRLLIGRRLLDRSGLIRHGAQGLDFGCGDGVLMERLLADGCVMEGTDIAPAMIERARRRLEGTGCPLSVGGIEQLAKLPAGRFDFIVALNVLAYFTPDEETRFFSEVSRILKPGGGLLVSNVNALFDLYTLNSFTREFLNREFWEAASVDASALLTHPELPQRTDYAVKANPLSYREVLRGFGLAERDRDFFNFHRIAPLLVPDGHTLNDYLVVDVDELDRIPEWKRMLACSTYFSLSVKE
ncbi:MAG: class I SAM-dependent methyltransferase [Rhodospirillaceae bacterium]|nr:class I SAM-dependent methyltransferase [Rhodospirillaceae bacterium]